jgi:hypothetical protein
MKADYPLDSYAERFSKGLAERQVQQLKAASVAHREDEWWWRNPYWQSVLKQL